MLAAFGLFVSGAALAVALYGIRERRVAARDNMRVRLTEVIEAIQGLGFDENRYLAEHPALTEWDRDQIGVAFNGKRQLLVSQAVSLIARGHFDKDLSSAEWSAVANGLSELARTPEACRVMDSAIKAARSDSEKADAYAGLAYYQFSQQRLDEGRQAYRTALSIWTPAPDDTNGWWTRFKTAEDWLQWEMSFGDGGIQDEPRKRASDFAERLPTSWQQRALAELAMVSAGVPARERQRQPPTVTAATGAA